MKKINGTLVDYQNLFENLTGLYLILTYDLTIVAVNNAYANATMTKREEIVGRKLFDVFPDNPEDDSADGVSNLLASLNYVRQHKTLHKMAIQKYDIRRPDGAFEIKYWSPVNSPILDEKHEIRYIVHQVEDVTEFISSGTDQLKGNTSEKKLQGKLDELQMQIIERSKEIQKINAELEKKVLERTEAIYLAQTSYQEIFENATDAIYIHEVESGKIVEVNQRAYEITGYSKEELLTTYLKDFESSHPDFPLEKALRLIQKAAKGETQTFEWLSKHKNGSLSWFEVNLKKALIGGTPRILAFFRDINERKKTSLQLQESVKTLEDYRFSLDQSAIIAITDAKGVITYFNDNFCKISKYQKEELIGKTHRVINSGHHPKEFFGQLWKTISSGKVWRGEIKNKAKDGTYYWVDTTIVPFLDTNRKPVQYLAIRFDVTARKLADEIALNALNEKNTILESIGDGFFTVDMDFTVTYWNRIAESFLNIPREKVIGRNLWDIFPHSIDSPLYLNYHYALEKKEVVHFEQYAGSLSRWLEISAFPSEKGLTVYFKDITDKKKADEHIRLSNERFEKVSEATNDAIWDWDINKDTIYWGRGYKKLFGHSPESSIEAWTKYVHPEDLERVLDSLQQTIHHADKSSWECEYRFLKKDRKYAHVIDRGVIIRERHQKAIRMIGAMSDISYHKEHEESLLKLNLELEKRAKELSISNSELEQFAYVASHDLQEPLRMVSSFLTQLEKKYGEKLDARANQYIHFAVDGAKRMRQIILDILEFSRIGKHEDKITFLHVEDIVRDVCMLQKKSIEEKKARILYNNLPVIQQYRSPLLQVFQNLIGNALKYSKEDTPPEIRVDAKELKNEWLFSVSDNGIGIDKEYFEKIFVIFQRLHTKDEFGGTGVGLAIVKKIIENMGGQLWLESEVGTGSTFYFTIKKS